MTFQDCADSQLGNSSKYDLNLSRARIAGYVLLTGLFLEVLASMIWFKGTESLASLIAIALVAAGVAGEIFFESRAQRTVKATAVAPSSNETSEPAPAAKAVQLNCVTRPNNHNRLSQAPNRDRRKLAGRCRRGRAAA